MLNIAIGSLNISFFWVLMVFLLATMVVRTMRGKCEIISDFHPACLIGTCFNVGRAPFSRGTWGSVFALYVLFEIFMLPRSTGMAPGGVVMILMLLTVALYLGGLWATDVYMKRTGIHDPKEIVIDELLGMFIMTLLVAAVYAVLIPLNPDFFYLLALAPYFVVVLFVLFRFFDIVKPWHVGKIDREHNDAHGVILDDVVAGIYAAISFYILYAILYYSGGFLWILKTYYPEFVEAQ